MPCFLLLVMLVLLCAPMYAQSTTYSDTLFKTIQSLDTQLFNAYNHCDLPAVRAMVSDDLEFYHDQTGLSVGNAPFIAPIKQNICGKVERTIVPGSMEVYPLKGYGAVEIGVRCVEFALFCDDFGEPIGEAVEAPPRARREGLDLLWRAAAPRSGRKSFKIRMMC